MQVRFPRGGLVVAACVAALVVAGCSSGSSGTTASTSSQAPAPTQAHPATLRIAYNPNPTNTTIVVAEQQGFFTKNGLDVKLTASQATAALMPSLGKQFDLITVTPPTLLQSAAQGLNPILVASEDIENSGKLRNTYLIGAKDVTSVSGLKGMTIGVPSLSGNLYEAAIIQLHGAGISKSEVKFLQVPFADMANDLTSGTIQAAVTIFPFQGQMLGEGMHDLGNPIEATVSDQTALSAGWAGYAPWVATHKAVIAAFNEAQDEALAWMNTHLAQARQVLVQNFQLPAFVASTFPVTQFVSFAPQAAYLSTWVAPMKAVGDLSSSFNTPVSQLIYTP